MLLKSWLQEKDLSVSEFAKKSDIPEQNLYIWMRGAWIPNKFYQKLLYEATEGAVGYDDWKKLKRKQKENNGKISKNTRSR